VSSATLNPGWVEDPAILRDELAVAQGKLREVLSAVGEILLVEKAIA
jgi:hypothetical protein